VPTKKSQVFSTARDNQPTVNVHVLQGERSMADDNQTLARFELIGIPPAPRGVPQIEVQFSIDANGIVSVGAKDLGTGREQSVRITAQSGLSEDEIQRLVDEAQTHKSADEAARHSVELKNQAEGLIYATERSLTEFASALNADEIARVKKDIEQLQKALDTNDTAGLQVCYKALESSAYRITETIYAAG